MPQYKKVFDIGTYTGNGGAYRVGIPTLRSVGPTGTQVAGATRFRASNSNYLSRTYAGTGLSPYIKTVSVWVKRGSLGADIRLFNSDATTSSCYLNFGSTNALSYNNGNAATALLTTTQLFRDTSIWYHIVLSIDTTQATASNRVKIYINGVQVTSFSASNYPSQNATVNLFGKNSANNRIGTVWDATANFFDGYMSELYHVDGQQLAASSFGEYNSDGIWVPKSYAGGYGTNGFYLPMNSSTNYATDQSGNGNNWTPSGFNVTTANATYDIMTDSPTDYLGTSKTTANNAGNYATLDYSSMSLVGASGYMFNGGLSAFATNSSAQALGATGTLSMTSGKWYWEVNAVAPNTFNSFLVGVCLPTDVRDGSVGCYLGAFGTASSSYGGSNQTGGTSYTNGCVIGVAYDADTRRIWFSVNNTWQYSGNPSTNTSPAFTLSASTIGYVPLIYLCGTNLSGGTSTAHFNFGQRAFTYTPPAGFNAINTYNITRPADSSLWFYGDTPDLMWIKNRTTTGLHTIIDTVRGVGLNLVTSSTAAETSYPGVTEMNKFGMSIINDGTSILNGSGNSMVYWAWKAGSNTSSSSVTNTSGTITSQVSANRQAGFSIVSYTGTGANATIGHGLGATPGLLMVKQRSTAVDGFIVWSTELTNQQYLQLNSTSARGIAATVWNSTTPTSSVFSVGTATGTNSSAVTYIAYCWAAIPGYSAFGAYTGNGSAAGPFIYLGFRPRFIMLKGSSFASNWNMFDISRNTYNVTGQILRANLANAEFDGNAITGGSLDILSNGFKLRKADGDCNSSGQTFIYAAFAEIPFKFSRAR